MFCCFVANWLFCIISFHNGIILIVNRFRFCIGKFMVFFNEKQKNMNKCAIISFFSVNLGKISKNHNYELLFRT